MTFKIFALTLFLPTLLLAAPQTKTQQATTKFIQALRETGITPTALIAQAINLHPLVFVGDSHLAAEPKEILVDSIGAAEKAKGVDAVVLEVSSSFQPVIDAYLASFPEDVSILINAPQTLRSHWGSSIEYLNIYRSIWELNQLRVTKNKILIIAADHPKWPLPIETLPTEIAQTMEERDAHMSAVITQAILALGAKARIVIFMGSSHGAKVGSLEISFGEGFVAKVYPIGRRLNEFYPGRLFTVMVDGMPEIEDYGNGFTSYGFSPYFDILFSSSQKIQAPVAIHTSKNFDFVSKSQHDYEDVKWNEKPLFRNQFNAYVYLGRPRMITLITGP